MVSEGRYVCILQKAFDSIWRPMDDVADQHNLITILIYYYCAVTGLFVGLIYTMFSRVIKNWWYLRKITCLVEW